MTQQDKHKDIHLKFVHNTILNTTASEMDRDHLEREYIYYRSIFREHIGEIKLLQGEVELLREENRKLRKVASENIFN